MAVPLCIPTNRLKLFVNRWSGEGYSLSPTRDLSVAGRVGLSLFQPGSHPRRPGLSQQEREGSPGLRPTGENSKQGGWVWNPGTPSFLPACSQRKGSRGWHLEAGSQLPGDRAEGVLTYSSIRQEALGR